MATDDIRGVDELSRRWLRGREALAALIRQVGDALDALRSEVSDAHETVWGAVGLVTCWLEQDYTFRGQRQHVSAPTSAVLRREGDGWRIAMFQSVPLPEAPGA